MKNRSFLKAFAVFAGTIIGVGIFGLPYVAMKVGWLVVVGYFLFMAILAIVIHTILGEVAHDTQAIARIPGYAGEYLGKKVKNFSFIISSLGLIGSCLAYLILGGQFLHSLLFGIFGGPQFIYLFIFFFFSALLIYKGADTIANLQVIVQSIFFMFLLFFVIKGFPHIDLKNFITFNHANIVMPYGIILFSLWGVALVPEIKEMVDRNRQKMLGVITRGIIFATICYLLFISVILGVSGPNTTKDAITGFGAVIGNGIISIGFIFGLIIVFTSFITLGMTLKKILWYDLKLSQNKAWALSCFLPLFLYLIGLRNFIDVIGVTGAVFLGTEGIIVLFIYRSFLKKRFQRKAGISTYVLAFLLAGGALIELFYFLIK
ncbi:amino acid permease [Patescibacteria group bacterium]|nr:amino acid permease [Patescibacteria group bacterium]